MKISKKQHEELKKLSKVISELQNQIGLNSINHHKLLHVFSQQEIKLTEFKKEIHEEYGKCNIDIDTGKIEKVDEDEQTNKKD